MACTDDDERVPEPRPRIDSFRLGFASARFRMASETPEQRQVARLSNGKWVIHQHYIPFEHTQWYPVGCTRTHAFAVIKSRHDEYTPICMHLAYSGMARPSQCLSASQDFISPWKRYSEPFSGFLGGCAHGERVCLVLRDGVLVIDSMWKTRLRDNCFALSTLVSCTMNARYLVVVGVETGMSSQSMIVYDFHLSPPRRILYDPAIQPPVRTVSLLNDIEHAMLVQCENGRTRRVLIQEQQRRPRFVVKDMGDLTTIPSDERPHIAKELADSSRIVQIVDTAFVLVKSKDDVDRTAPWRQLFVDVADYSDGVVVSHDSNNALHFFTSKLVHIISVPWESIAAASLLYENGVPSILRPYASLSRCVDSPDTVVLLASFGALVTIKVL